MLSNSSVPLVGIVDTAVMSRMGSPEWIAATAVATVIFSTIYWMFGFLRMGTGGLVAQSHGAGDQREVSRILTRACLLAIVLAAFLLALQSPLKYLSLFAMQDDGAWKPLTETYFNVRILSAPATLLTYVAIATLVGLQRMRQVLLLQLLLNFLNIALTISLFRYTSLGIAGVALATVISEYVALVYGIYLLRSEWISLLQDRLVSQWLFDAMAWRRLFGISIDLFIRTLALLFAFYSISVLGSRQGVAVLAANSILMHMVYFCSYTMDGFAHAAETLTGYAIGIKSQRFFKQAMIITIQFAVATSLLFVIVYSLFGSTILSLLSVESSTHALAIQWLPWVVAIPITGIWSYMLDGIFTGATETIGMRNSVLQSLLIFLVAASIFVPILGNHGLWLSLHCLLLTRAITLWRYRDRVLIALNGRLTQQSTKLRKQ